MAERILSPAVYIQESDQSFTQPGITPSGLAVVGPTLKGQAFVPTLVTSFTDFQAKFGGETNLSYVPYTTKNYLRSGTNVLVVRVLGAGGWSFDGSVRKLAAIVTGSKIIAAFHPTQNTNPTLAELGSSTVTGSFTLFNLVLSGSQVSKTASGSLNPSSNSYLTKVFGTGPSVVSGSGWPYILFANFLSASVAVGSSSYSDQAKMILSTTSCTFTSSNAGGYSEAITPWVISPAGVRLFRFHHISHGTITNRDVKVAVDNIITSTTLGVNSTFNIVVRRFGDTDNVPSVLEQYNNVSINSNDNSTYLVAKIGDIYSQYDSTQNKVITFGNYANSSNYIRVEVGDAVKNGTLDPSTVPGGFEAVFETIVGFAGISMPSASMLQSSSSLATFSGFDYSNADNINYLNPVPQEAGNGNNVNFLLNANDIKFMLPFQYGTDGMNYTVIPKRGNQISSTNTFGFDLSTAQSAGALSYIQAFNIISDRDQYSFNILATPGVINNIHTAVVSTALSTVTSRGDAIYILDLVGHDDTIATATQQAASLDSSYGCTYFPWVKILDGTTGKLTSVPPSVVIPQTFAYTDTVSHPWFAPAGLNRGGIGGVIDVVNKLNKSDRDTLYVAKVNPIASFPNTGITVWGQKTLQVNQNTALTRINVRRLLITLEAQIRNISNFLIFENNTVALRNQFLNKVNPLLSQVVAQQGLYAYKVVMDDSNNTPSVIDQNQLVGAIYLQPAKAVEFIILTFNITPTGVTF